MEGLRQGSMGPMIPLYMEEILINNYCPYFLKMNMVRENENYKFNYQTGRFRKVNFDNMDLYNKLILLRSLLILNERNSEWLIKAENYMIEPELIYCLNNCVDDGSVRMLFYPDNKRVSFEQKIIDFSEKIKNKNDSREMDVLNKFRDVAQTGDSNRTRLFLDKNILRLETRKEMHLS